MVPVYEEDEPNTRRKVQRITSPEKWELKQVNIDSEKKNNTIIQDRIGAHVVYKGSFASCIYCYVGETSAHVSSPVQGQIFSRFETFQNSDSCRISCSTDCFNVFDFVATVSS